MKIEYRGYAIEVTAKRKDGLWAADVCIGPLIGDPTALRQKGEVDGADSEGDAEVAGVQWGRYRVDLYVLPEL
jgi:hypothetical protein